MEPSEKFKEIALASKDAIEDFNDFAEDRANSWAYDEIKRLSAVLDRIADFDCVYGVGCVTDNACKCAPCIAAEAVQG